MAQVINTNIASLNAQRNLNSTQSQLQTSLTRLSSGLRVNSAKDDAAGLAIAERFSTQVKGLTVASRNANDAISLSQTAEGAMGEIGNNLQRIRELAVQSANHTNSAGDREALNNEVRQLVNEIDRVAAQTDFNGTRLLDGSFSGALFQIGANAGQTISVNNIVNAQAQALGGVKFADTVTATMAGNAEATDLSLNGVKIASVESTGTAEGNAKALAAAVNERMDRHGVWAEVVDGNQVTLHSIKGNTDLVISGSSLGGFNAGTTSAADSAITATDALDVSTFQGSQRAIEIATAALTEVNTARSEMGAVQNRFESVIANLATTNENLTSSRSRIEDADFAAETAALTRSQILTQAGTAMLAQANTMPQSVLSLLQ